MLFQSGMQHIVHKKSRKKGRKTSRKKEKILSKVGLFPSQKEKKWQHQKMRKTLFANS